MSVGNGGSGGRPKSTRSGLGIVGVVLGLAALTVAFRRGTASPAERSAAESP